jgi:hypothetical protein
MYRSPLNNEANVRFVLKGTTGTLFTYKKWLETYIGIQDVANKSFHYYNCSEEGILGVVPYKINLIDLDDVNNWRLLDDIIPKRYHTRMFEDAVIDFLSARELCRIQAETDCVASPAIVLPGRTAGANSIGPNLIKT